jgi:hypothetical protein
MNPKTTWRGSLESFGPYLLLKKVSKNPHAFLIHNKMPKTHKAIFWSLKSLKSFRD